jgi:N-acyl-D-amino-acid deacylase
MTRMLLRGGLVADGIGDVVRRADVLIDGPLISWIGSVRDVVSHGECETAECEVVDLAPGSVVCPGFIDTHVHAEGPLLESGCVRGALAQGVTTLVVGQDGQSWIGASAATAGYLNRYFGPVNGTLEPARGLSVAEFRDAVAGGLVQNVAVLASQGTIRHNVAGMRPGRLGPDELVAARRHVEQALADGAVGLSSGLDYLPSRFGEVDEIAFMAAPLAEAGRPYVSHLRGYGPAVAGGLDELAAVGRAASVRVHASHLWGPQEDLAAALGRAEATGVAVSFDMYPYRRSSTILAVLLLPPQMQAGGPSATLAALGSPRERAALLASENFSDDYLASLYLGCLPGRAARFAGMSITEAAGLDGRPAGEWAIDLLVSTGLGVGAHLDRPALTDEQLAWIADDDRHCAGSDGIYQGQHPHPRGYGAFARLAGHYLATGRDVGYQRLARHLAANAADAYGLRARGRLAPGMAADICVIGPAGITERATYDAPREHADGVHLVIVNGITAWRDGGPSGNALAGQFVIV